MTVSHVSPSLWQAIVNADGASLITPGGQRNFLVGEGGENHIDVFTGMARETRVRLPRWAFEQTLAYLSANGHVDAANAIEVKANQDPGRAGPLCRAARLRPNGTFGPRVVTYVLPILEFCDVVGINRCALPSVAWLEP